MNMLPEACVATILSFTSPADTFSSSSVSSVFRSAADSDYVWEKFLPSDCSQIISRSTVNLVFSSKKQLFRCLCEPVLLDNEQRIFNLSKTSGKISYTLSARQLVITWGDERLYWSWNFKPESRFPEVAELITTNWLEIQGTIRSGQLSPNTRYGAYLRIKMNSRAFGLDLIPSEISIKVGKELVCRNTAWLCCLDSKKRQMQRLMYGNREEMMRGLGGEGKEPIVRKDGWRI